MTFAKSMEKDIDRIIQQVKEQLPEAEVSQAQKIYPVEYLQSLK